MIPLLSLGIEEVRGLRSQIQSWKGEMGLYKGVESWGQLVRDWCDEMLGENGME